MKTVIFYSSIYNGNTLKIAESMASDCNGSFQHCLYKEKTYSYFPPAVVRSWAITTEH